MNYDVIVVGGGHAGIEAALASARMGQNTLMISILAEQVGATSCNPAVGGLAKGHLVRELDALGGEMAKITDSSAIQYKTLNTRKGPAVHSTRTQNDKALYSKNMKSVIERTKNLDLKQAMAQEILLEMERMNFLKAQGKGFAPNKIAYDFLDAFEQEKFDEMHEILMKRET